MLTSLQNQLVKDVRKLHQSKFRRQQQQFLLEGTHLLQEALLAAYPIDIGCHTEAWAQRYPALANDLRHHAARVEVVSEPVMAALATTVHPDGVVAIVPRREASPDPDLTGIGLAIETLQDPGNLGTIIRTAVATQTAGLWLSDSSVAPDHPKVLRASAGQWFRLPLEVCTDLSTQVDIWRQRGLQIVATSPTAPLVYWDIDFTQPTVILLGSEAAGLSPDLQHQATVLASIPMDSAVESLNVGISAALLLYEAQRQRRHRLGL